MNIKKTVSGLFLMIAFLLACNDALVGSETLRIENINMKNQGLMITFNGRADYQTVQIDNDQVLIALKGTFSNQEIPGGKLKNPFIRQVSFDKLSGNITALVVYTTKEIKTYHSKWIDAQNTLMVNFVKS